LDNGRFEYSGTGQHQPQFRGAGKKNPTQGRWPANVIHDGSEEVVAAFPESAPSKMANRGVSMLNSDKESGWARPAHENYKPGVRGHDDKGGSAARFFYHAKANKNDRAGSRHPTVKPVDLIQYLIRLVTPKGGVVLDPFAGSGTAGEAARREGVRAVLIEREVEYQNDIRARLTPTADSDQPTLFDERNFKL
jgi:site-specific DNA-methyltransferase (adenine-specific)